MKKENYNYFDEFILMTDYIVKSSNTLKEIMGKFDLEKLNEDIYEVHNLENEADKIVHNMKNHLIKDFIPPIDREDISLIINRLDNIEDGIDEILINVKILNIETVKTEVFELIDILIMCCEAVKEMFVDFKKLKNIVAIKQKIIQVNKLEEVGDRIYEKLMSELYKNEKNPIELIKWTNIYNCLENTIDFCEEISDCIEDVILKNS